MNLFYDLVMVRNTRDSFAVKKNETDDDSFDISAMHATIRGTDCDRNGPVSPLI